MQTHINYSQDDMEQSELCINNLFVAFKERGKGKARELVAEAIEYANENNYATVGLYAEPQEDDGLNSSDLVGFYKSCGFVSDGDCSELMTYTC